MPFVADAQSFNVDVDVEFAPPQLGGGVPSSSFGAAANQPGVWHRLYYGWGAENLTDIHGNVTSVQISDANGGSGSAYNVPINTGDFALLLNDARDTGRFGESFSFSLSGLTNGPYKVYVYAVAVQTVTQALPARTRVTQSINPGDQIITGPMPGNSFAQGITHSIHDVIASNGSLDIQVMGDNPLGSNINGFQIVQVPEPQQIISFSIPSLIVIGQVFRSRKGGT